MPAHPPLSLASRSTSLVSLSEGNGPNSSVLEAPLPKSLSRSHFFQKTARNLLSREALATQDRFSSSQDIVSGKNYRGVDLSLLDSLKPLIGEKQTIWGEFKKGWHSFKQGVKELPTLWTHAKQWLLKKIGFHRQALPKPMPSADFIEKLLPGDSPHSVVHELLFREAQGALKEEFNTIEEEVARLDREGDSRWTEEQKALSKLSYLLKKIPEAVTEGKSSTKLTSLEKPILLAYLCSYSGSMAMNIEMKRTQNPTSDIVLKIFVLDQLFQTIGNFFNIVGTLASHAQVQAHWQEAQEIEAMGDKSQAPLLLPEGMREELRQSGEEIRQSHEKINQLLEQNEQELEAIKRELQSPDLSEADREALEGKQSDLRFLRERYQDNASIIQASLEVMDGAPLSRKFAESVLENTQNRLFPTSASTIALMANTGRAFSLMKFNRVGRTAVEAGSTFDEIATVFSLLSLTLVLAVPSFSYLIAENIASLKQAWHLRGKTKEGLESDFFSRLPQEALAHELLGENGEMGRGRAFLEAMGRANNPEIVSQGVTAQFWVWAFGLIAYGQMATHSWMFGAPAKVISAGAAIGGTWGVGASVFSIGWTVYNIGNYFRRHYKAQNFKEVAFDEHVDWVEHGAAQSMLQTTGCELDYRQAAKQMASEVQYDLKDFVTNQYQHHSLSKAIADQISREQEAGDFALNEKDVVSMSQQAGQTYAETRLQGKSEREAHRQAKIHFLLQALTQDHQLGDFLESRSLGDSQAPEYVHELFQNAGLSTKEAQAFFNEVFHTYAQARLEGKSEKVALRQAEAQYRMKRVELQGLPELLEARRVILEQVLEKFGPTSSPIGNPIHRLQTYLGLEAEQAQKAIHRSLQRYAENRWKGINQEQALQKERYLYAQSMGQLALQKLLPGGGETTTTLNLESLLKTCASLSKAEQKAVLANSQETAFLIKALGLAKKEATELLRSAFEAYQGQSSLKEAMMALQKGIIDLAQEPYISTRKPFGTCDELEILLKSWEAKDQQTLREHVKSTSGAMEEEWSALLGEVFQSSKTLNAMTLGYCQSYQSSGEGESGEANKKATQAWAVISGQVRKVFERAIIKEKQGYGSLEKAPEAWQSFARAIQKQAIGLQKTTDDGKELIEHLQKLGVPQAESRELADWLFLVSEDQRAQGHSSTTIQSATQAYAQQHLSQHLYKGVWKTLASQWKRSEKRVDPLEGLAFLDKAIRVWNKQSKQEASISLVGRRLASLGMKPSHIQSTLVLSALTYEAAVGVPLISSEASDEAAVKKGHDFFTGYLDHAAGVYARNDRAWGKVWERKKWDAAQVGQLVQILHQAVEKDPQLQQWYQQSLGVKTADACSLQETLELRAKLNARLLALSKLMGLDLHHAMIAMVEDVKLNEQGNGQESESRRILRFLGLPEPLIDLAFHAHTLEQVHELASKWETWSKNPNKAEQELPEFTQSFA